jgi:hypothetical protein
MGLLQWLRSRWRERQRPWKAVVSFDERGVACHRRDGSTESVEWDDLHAVEIMTTDQGPFVDDVFFVLHGTHTGCVVPQEADGSNELFQRLQQLPGFDNKSVIEAMGSTDNARFLCWRRSETDPIASSDSAKQDQTDPQGRIS